MAKVQTLSIPDFMAGVPWEEESIIDPLINHFRKHRIKYQVIGFTIIVFVGLSGTAFAGTGIDIQAGKIYDQLLRIGKWVIIVKGAVDLIQNVTKGDFEAAKKGTLVYFMVYLMLYALPWGMNQIDSLFSDLKSS